MNLFSWASHQETLISSGIGVCAVVLWNCKPRWKELPLCLKAVWQVRNNNLISCCHGGRCAFLAQSQSELRYVFCMNIVVQDYIFMDSTSIVAGTATFTVQNPADGKRRGDYPLVKSYAAHKCTESLALMSGICRMMRKAAGFLQDFEEGIYHL